MRSARTAFDLLDAVNSAFQTAFPLTDVTSLARHDSVPLLLPSSN
jgi:hypothetical protein